MKFKTSKRKIIFISLLFLILFCSINCQTIWYGLKQGKGQLHIICNTIPISEVLADQNFPDSLKQKLLLVQEVRQFAVDSLGINDTENYKTLYDQKGKPILWVVVASDAYKLNAYQWSFPILGSFSYKGFFNYEEAKDEAAGLSAKGYDTRIGTVSAWSTLGYFKDPILSNMLFRSEGELAELIIHELTHATLYVKDSIQFNENLATFVGVEGAKLFLNHRYGCNSKFLADYIGNAGDEKKYSEHILRGALKLDSLYETFSKIKDKTLKDSLKSEAIGLIIKQIDTINFYDKNSYAFTKNKNFRPNNSYFVSFKTYNDNQKQLEQVYKTQFNSNFEAFLNYYKQKYSSL